MTNMAASSLLVWMATSSLVLYNYRAKWLVPRHTIIMFTQILCLVCNVLVCFVGFTQAPASKWGVCGCAVMSADMGQCSMCACPGPMSPLHQIYVSLGSHFFPSLMICTKLPLGCIGGSSLHGLKIRG